LKPLSARAMCRKGSRKRGGPVWRGSTRMGAAGGETLKGAGALRKVKNWVFGRGEGNNKKEREERPKCRVERGPNKFPQGPVSENTGSGRERKKKK